jgi:hypothetical protein
MPPVPSAVLNDRGQAIGIVTSKLRGSEGLNFAVPINYVRGMLEELHKPMSLDELRVSLSSTKTDVFKSSGYPALWRSLSTGKVRNLRFEGEFIYGETLLTEEQRKFQFDSYELKKDKDAYKGVIRSGGTCNYLSSWDRSAQHNRCSLDGQIEFTSATPNRIEGRGFGPPAGAKFDCKKCSYSKAPVWTPFVWIPR